jgi:hypothetical protein
VIHNFTNHVRIKVFDNINAKGYLALEVIGIKSLVAYKKSGEAFLSLSINERKTHAFPYGYLSNSQLLAKTS